MPQQKAKANGAQEIRAKKNFNNSEVEALLQKVNAKQLVLLSNVSGGHKATD